MVKKRGLLIFAIFLIISLVSCTYPTKTEPPSLTFNTGSTSDTTSDNTTEIIESNDPKSISLLMVGDILLHEKVVESGTKDDGAFDFNPIFSILKQDIQSYDIAIANQEVILGGAELGISGYPNFNGPYEVGDALVSSGFDIIAHATNHALDKNKDGVLNCINFWQSNHPDITFLGVNSSQQMQDSVYIREEKGVKIAFLNYTYGTNGMQPPSDMPYIVNYLNETKVISDLQYAEANADFTVVLPHWGTEYIHTSDSSQEYWTDIFVTYGADLIIGTHPHVIEPVEWYSKGDNKALVYYSLGNFVSCTAESGVGKCDRMLGAMADVTLKIDDNIVSIDKYGVIPIVTHIENGYGGIKVYKFKDYTEDLASKSYTNQVDSTFSIDYYNNLCASVFGELYK